jgi:hypothetical protein
MNFQSLLTDSVVLLKKNGITFNEIKASVQKNKIFIHRSDLLIEPGDLIQRKMSNGGEEIFEVIDPGFHEKFHGIPAGYQMDVRKLGLPEAEKAVQSITYNISGNNARINQNSVDNSINIIQSNQELQEHLQALRDEILRLKISSSEEKEALEIIDAVEQQANSNNPRKAVVKTLLSGLPNAGNIASIGSFIISLLE